MGVGGPAAATLVLSPFPGPGACAARPTLSSREECLLQREPRMAERPSSRTCGQPHDPGCQDTCVRLKAGGDFGIWSFTAPWTHVALQRLSASLTFTPGMNSSPRWSHQEAAGFTKRLGEWVESPCWRVGSQEALSRQRLGSPFSPALHAVLLFIYLFMGGGSGQAGGGHTQGGTRDHTVLGTEPGPPACTQPLESPSGP